MIYDFLSIITDNLDSHRESLTQELSISIDNLHISIGNFVNMVYKVSRRPASPLSLMGRELARQTSEPLRYSQLEHYGTPSL